MLASVMVERVCLYGWGVGIKEKWRRERDEA